MCHRHFRPRGYLRAFKGLYGNRSIQITRALVEVAIAVGPPNPPNTDASCVLTIHNSPYAVGGFGEAKPPQDPPFPVLRRRSLRSTGKRRVIGGPGTLWVSLQTSHICLPA